MESIRLVFDPSARQGSMPFLGYRDSIFQGSRAMSVNMEEGSRMRPFFSSPDDLFDDEYSDEQSSKKRRLTSEQVYMLEKSFEEENKLEPERKIQLAKKLGLQSRQVAVWFQNRRVRWKTKQLERDYDILKSSYHSLLSDYESTVMENVKLKFEVISLTEKLQGKEAAGAPIPGQKPGPHPADMAAVSAIQISSVKVEDRLSCGSEVEDEDAPQLVDCGNSYFPDECFGFMVPSEEDDGSYGESCFSDVFAAAAEQQNEGETMQWWVWS